VTVDTPVAGLRERDLRNGAHALVKGSALQRLPHAWQFVARPRWFADFMRDGGLMKFPNVVSSGGEPMPYDDVGGALERSTVAWEDLAWIAAEWGGPLVIKGILTAEDARRAVAAGAHAVVVSNHGGRQLDGVAPTLRALPEVVAAAGDRCEVLLDSGIRRGSDVVKALCLGARAVLVGRAYAYGLAASGGPGVARAIEILRGGVIRTLRLLGCHDVAKLDGSYVEWDRSH
jgi:L-lactate dehydrogenase (cytochrome)